MPSKRRLVSWFDIASLRTALFALENLKHAGQGLIKGQRCPSLASLPYVMREKQGVSITSCPLGRKQGDSGVQQKDSHYNDGCGGSTMGVVEPLGHAPAFPVVTIVAHPRGMEKCQLS